MRFKEVVLHSTNLRAQQSFYEETLTLNIIEATDEYLRIEAGETTLTYIYVSDKPQYVYHIAFNIPENQLDSAMNWVGERVPVLGRPGNSDQRVFHYVDWNAHAIYFHDADTNVLEFIARHNLDNRNDESFTGANIINVSEVGMPVPDVQHAVAALQTGIGVPVWRGEGNDTFTVLGDEHGLLIVTKEGRPWLDSPTIALPVTIRTDDIDEDFALDGLPYVFKRT